MGHHFKRLHIFNVASIVLLCLHAPAALAETQAPLKAEAPDIKVGDSWTFDKIDGWKKSKDFTRVTTVTSVDDKEIRLELRRADNGETIAVVRNRDLNLLAVEAPSGANKSAPYLPTFSFPLEPGKTWEQPVTSTRSADPSRKVTATLKGTVIGWENVSVPAGTFQALKIEVGGYYKGSNARNTWDGQRFDTIWYAPEVKYFVKWIYRETDHRGTTATHEIVELAGYKIKQ